MIVRIEGFEKGVEGFEEFFRVHGKVFVIAADVMTQVDEVFVVVMGRIHQVGVLNKGKEGGFGVADTEPVGVVCQEWLSEAQNECDGTQAFEAGKVIFVVVRQLRSEFYESVRG